MQQIIYIASPNSQEIHVWKIDHNLSCKLMQILHTPGQVQPMILHPNKNNLYVGTRLIPKIINYHIEKNGTLNLIEEQLISGYSTHLNINKTGSILYSSSYNNNSLDIIKLNDSGNCISVLQTLPSLIGCHSSNIEIINQKLWVPCLKEDCIRIYDINNTGTLNINSLKTINLPINSGPRHMVFHYSYNYAYIINELNNTVNVIKINKSNNSTPTITQTINILSNNIKKNINKQKSGWGSDIHIINDSNWLYCSDRKTNTISYIKISHQGKQIKYIGSQITEKQPRGFAIDHTGKYLIVAGQKSNFCSIYQLNKETGKLALIFRFPAGIGPSWITILS